MIKEIYTNWSDIIVNEGDMWCDKINGGYTRTITSTFGIPVEFNYDWALLDDLREHFNGEYVYITEHHQNMDPAKALPGLQINDDGSVDSTSYVYYTKIYQIISFSDQNDAALFKLYMEKQNKCLL